MPLDNNTTQMIEFLLNSDLRGIREFPSERKLFNNYRQHLGVLYSWFNISFNHVKKKNIFFRLSQIDLMLHKQGNAKRLSKVFLLVLDKESFSHPHEDLELVLEILNQSHMSLINSDQNTYFVNLKKVVKQLLARLKDSEKWQTDREFHSLIEEFFTLQSGWLYDLTDAARELVILEQQIASKVQLKTFSPGCSITVSVPSAIHFMEENVAPGANVSHICIDDNDQKWVIKPGRIHIQISEYITGKLLFDSGLPTPITELAYDNTSGIIFLLSRMIDSASNVHVKVFVKHSPTTSHDRLIIDSLLFMIWLHNRDARLSRNYILSDGKYYMLDFGGSLLGKPRGGRRNEIQEDIDEKVFLERLEYFCKKGKNPNPFFSRVTYNNLLRSCRRLEAVTPEHISCIVSYAYKYLDFFRKHHKLYTLFHPFPTAEELTERLIVRRQQILTTVRENKEKITSFLSS